MEGIPAPLVPADVDLKDFPFMPVEIARLFGSEFHALASDAEWRAGVTLWLKSYHQVPAASLPDDDVALARLAELGRDVKAWKKIRANALRGWLKCSDGRLYHPVVAEKALEAWIEKLAQRRSSGAGNSKRWGVTFDASTIDDALTVSLGLLRTLNPHSRSLSRRPPKPSGGDPDGSPDGTLNGAAKHPDGSPDYIPAQSQEKGREGKKEDKPAAQHSTTAAPSGLNALHAKLLRAANPGDWPLAVCPSIAPIPRLIADGCDEDLDVVPVISELAEAARNSGTRIGTWNYFAGAIREARDERLAGRRPKPSGANGHAEPKAPDWVIPADFPPGWPECIPVLKPETAYRIWRGGSWPVAFGPLPGDPGCRLPPSVVVDWTRRAEGEAA